MKTTFKQKLSSLALSFFAFASFAQCPTSAGIYSVTTVNNGYVAASGLASPSNTSTVYYFNLTNGSNLNFDQWGTNSNFSYSNVPSGTYSLCLQVSDSVSQACPILNTCTTVVVTNTLIAPCPSATNTSLSFQYGASGQVTASALFFGSPYIGSATWHYNNITNTTNANPVIFNIANNGHYTVCVDYNANNCPAFQKCDTINIYSAGGTGTTTATCNAGFTSYTDSNCVTLFLNTSTGSNLTYEWRSGPLLLSTQQNPSLALPQGNFNIVLYTFSNGSFCDSVTQIVSVACGSSNPTGCNVSSQFLVFADSINAGNYFAYNQSSGNGVLSYLWNFGDGTTSTLAYPFHQYATPGQYAICLTVTSLSGSVTCTDVYCDSSSVHKTAASNLMSQLQVIASTTGLQEKQVAKHLSVYPNPVESEFNIEYVLQQNEKLTYKIMDALGKIVSGAELISSKTTINTSALDKGVYFLSISNETNKTIKTIKLIK